MLNLKNIQVSYGPAKALWDVSLHVNEGELVCVVSFLTPFGGFKESGMGRENGMDSIKEYTETKSVYVELTGEPRDPFTLG